MCVATRNWIKQMGVDKLPRKDRQPLYNVLVEDGSNRYAADDNLEVVAATEISHEEVGRYFQEFCPKRGYIPTKEKSEEYPDDQDIMEKTEEMDLHT